MNLRRYVPALILLVLVIGVQIATQLTNTTFYLTQMTMTAYYTLVVVGLCLLMGYAGQVSLGHAGFFAIGGYLSAALTTHDFTALKDHWIVAWLTKLGVFVAAQDMFGDTLLKMHPWPACLIAIAVALLIAFAIGIPVLKLKGHYLAMATLGFGIIIQRIVVATPFFGQADGISEVPAFTILPKVTVSGDLAGRVQNYYIAWALVLLGTVILLNLANSRVGRALRAIHGTEDAANAMGVNTARYKLNSFVLSALFAAIAGVLVTHYNGGIGPSEAGVMKSVRYVAILAIGGMGSLWGPVTMSVALNFLSLRGMFGSYDNAVFGAILILIMLFAPAGLLRVSYLHRMKQLFGKRADQHHENS